MSDKFQAAVGGTQATRREQTPYEKFRTQFERLRPEVAALVGPEKVDKFMRISLNAVQSNPDVLFADRRTLLLACMEAAQDGLLPDGREAVFNIYREKDKERSKAEQRDVYVDVVQYLPMVYGLIQLIYEAGATYVDAVAVNKEDKFIYQRGDEPKIEHVPYDGDGDPGQVKAAYVVVKMRTGETKREVMFRREIEKVKAKSKAPNGLMWKDFYDQGAIKSVIHRIWKQLPRSERLERALAKDNAAVGLADLAAAPQESGVPELAALVDGRLEQAERTIPATTIKQPEPQAAGGAAPEPKAAAAPAPAAAAAQEPERKDPPAPPAKQGDPGTPELKKKYLDAFKAQKDVDVLDIKFDETRFYTWSIEDAKELQDAFTARRGELTA